MSEFIPLSVPNFGPREAELAEQARLRAQYLKEFRENMEATLRAVRVEQADGTYKPLEKKKKPLN